MKKYKLIKSDSIKVGEHILFRIKALIAIPEYDVKPGDLGGYIEGEKNLSHEGKAWVGGEVFVYGNAKVSGNAWVYGKAKVSGNAEISGEMEVNTGHYCSKMVKVCMVK